MTEMIEIPRATAAGLRADIEMYLAGNPADSHEWSDMLDALDRIHDAVDELLTDLIELES